MSGTNVSKKSTSQSDKREEIVTYRFQNEDETDCENMCMRLKDGAYASYNPTSPDPETGSLQKETAIIARGYQAMVLRGDHRAAIESIANETDGDIEALAEFYKEHPPGQRITEYESLTGDIVIDQQLALIEAGLYQSRWED